MAKCKCVEYKTPKGEYLGEVITCPGCGDKHVFYARTHSGPGWSFNGNREKPTFSPSMLSKSGHYIDGKIDECWCRYAEQHPNEQAPFKCGICHSFVTDGKIQFLSDCTHDMAGQTVELPDIE
jgi:hypothetical protein